MPFLHQSRRIITTKSAITRTLPPPGLSGDDAKVEPLKDGYDVSLSVVQIGHTAWVLEGQLDHLFNPKLGPPHAFQDHSSIETISHWPSILYSKLLRVSPFHFRKWSRDRPALVCG